MKIVTPDCPLNSKRIHVKSVERRKMVASKSRLVLGLLRVIYLGEKVAQLF